MLEKFFPDEYVDSIYHIKLNELKNKGIKGIIFDIDNTLVPYDVEIAHDKLVKWLQTVKEAGFKICLVSNNNKSRVMKFNESLNYPAIHSALKPMRRNFKRAMQLIGTTKSETAIVGDQIFTDVLGGNMIGIRTILVVPIQDKEAFVSKVKRGLERKIIQLYQNKR